MNIIYEQNCSFREWYDTYKSEIITLYYEVYNWIENEDFYVYVSREEFYTNFVHFLYKNSIPHINKTTT